MGILEEPIEHSENKVIDVGAGYYLVMMMCIFLSFLKITSKSKDTCCSGSDILILIEVNSRANLKKLDIHLLLSGGGILYSATWTTNENKVFLSIKP